jgi:hypothetical protein
MPPAGLLRAIEQFNRAEFWDAHETLEELWRHEEDAVRSLYQGILLVGVGLHHLLRGNYRGARTKLRAGMERLAPYGPVCQGVEVAGLLAATERCYAALPEERPRKGPAGAGDDASAEGVSIVVDRALIPRIALAPRHAWRGQPEVGLPSGDPALTNGEQPGGAAES